MIKVNFYDFNKVEDEKLLFAVIMAKYKDNWIYVRHKERRTFEIPGGHREKGESINEAAARELFEETGAIEYTLSQICVYSVERDEEVEYTKSFGGLFYAEVDTLDDMPDFEMSEVKLFKEIPEELTYPLIQPYLHNKVENFKK